MRHLWEVFFWSDMEHYTLAKFSGCWLLVGRQMDWGYGYLFAYWCIHWLGKHGFDLSAGKVGN